MLDFCNWMYYIVYKKRERSTRHTERSNRETVR